MTNWIVVERTLWCVSAVATIVGCVTWHRVAANVAEARPVVVGRGATIAPAIEADSLESLASQLAEADPFRLARRPADVAYHSAPDGPPPPPPPPKPPKPALALSGTVGGPPWSALLDGLPGHDQSVLVHAGDSLAGLRVRSVTRTRVIVTGMDTTWRLEVRRPWP